MYHKILLTSIVTATTLMSCTTQQDSKQPNILLIMADDMGYSDLGCYGGEIETPNLDKMAENGIKFTQFYNAARCCPTRASLMTGLYPHECGIGHMTHITAGPGYLGYLNDSCITIPEVLAEAGYATSIAGKWHAGTLKDSWPENRGFQRSYSIHNWVDSYFKVLRTCEIYEDGKIVIPATATPGDYDSTLTDKEWYTTDVFTSKSIEYIDKAREDGKPFFHYLAYNAPHWPLEAHDEDIQKYLNSYEDGYEALRQKKYQRMKEMGLIPETWDLPEQDTPDWDSLDETTKENLKFLRAIYAAQIDRMDQNIGRLLKHLDKIGELNNTLIFFLSDNGCSAEPMGEDYGWSWGRNTKQNYKEWRKNSGRAGTSQGRIWTVTSNTPFRKFKRYTHEGGISTPLIISWPNGVKNPGRMNHTPGHIIDILATCVDVGNAVYPKERNGVPLIENRGVSLKNIIHNAEPKQHEFIFWEHEGHGALRKDNWKLVSVDPSNRDLWELYDINKDRTEVKDLSETYPDIRAELISFWEKEAYATKVWPKPTREMMKSNPIEK